MFGAGGNIRFAAGEDLQGDSGGEGEKNLSSGSDVGDKCDVSLNDGFVLDGNQWNREGDEKMKENSSFGTATSHSSEHHVQQDSLATHELEREIKRIKVEKIKSEESRLQLKYSLREAEEQIICLKASADQALRKVSSMQVERQEFMSHLEELKNFNKTNDENLTGEINELKKVNQTMKENLTKCLIEENEQQKKRAMYEELCRLQRREVLMLQEEKRKLQAELEKKEKELSLLDEDRRKAVEGLEKFREKIRAERGKDGQEELSDCQLDLVKFKRMTSSYFDQKKRAHVVKRSYAKLEVKCGGAVGFSLQNFFDGNYYAAKNTYDQNPDAHTVLFEGDFRKGNISKYILAEWRIFYVDDYAYESEGMCLNHRIIVWNRNLMRSVLPSQPHFLLSCINFSKQECRDSRG